MSGPVHRSTTYWPTLVVAIEGNTASLSYYGADGSGVHVRKSTVSRLDEILADLRDWIERESAT